MAFEITDQIRHRLTDDTLVWLTTVSPSGRPAPRLVWFIWIAESAAAGPEPGPHPGGGQSCVIYSQPGTAKLRHIAGNDRVTLNFNSNDLGGDAVVLAGRAELAPDLPSAPGIPGLLDKYAALLDAIGMTAEQFTDTYSIPIRVLPDRTWTIPA